VADPHEHEHEHDEDEHDEGEIEITINPREEDLERLGVTPEEFESALMATLDAYDKTIEAADPDSVTPLEDARITLGGKSYPLQEVADIEISGGLDDLGDSDDDEDEFEDEDEDEDGDEPQGSPHPPGNGHGRVL